MSAAESTPDRTPGKGHYQALMPSGVASVPLVLTPQARVLWEDVVSLNPRRGRG